MTNNNDKPLDCRGVTGNVGHHDFLLIEGDTTIRRDPKDYIYIPDFIEQLEGMKYVIHTSNETQVGDIVNPIIDGVIKLLRSINGGDE